MPRVATVYDIFIASPGDVAEEREIAVKVIHKWNDLHSLARAIMLRPVRYEKNSRPTTKYEGQEAVNRQCLDFSDLVVGIFGNRLGTPTSKAESGTAEEIDRHVAAGKEAIIFFSDRPVPRRLTAEEKEQLEKLNAYQDAWRNKANIGSFGSKREFESEFDKALTLYMNSITSLLAPSLQPQENPLSEYELEILKYAFQRSGFCFATRRAQDEKYLIAPVGCATSKPSDVLNAAGNDETNMLYEAAIKSLEKREYIEKYREPSKVCKYYKLYTPNFETIKKILADDLTRAPKTTGNSDDSK